MYESFFNLKRKPFELVPDPDFIYLSRSYNKALTYLDYGIRERAGFILLTGEVGSGKTTLIRNLLNRKYDKVVLAKVFNTRVSSEQLFAMINEDFGISVASNDKVSLMRELNDFLLEQYANNRQPILVIDEAQNLTADLLEEVRMLSNLESSHCKLLQIVLVGQPELRNTLAAPELLQLRQRISITCHLTALTREEMGQYIEHRMKVAGNASALVFTGETLDLVHRYSRGIPRLINIFCDFILLSAFADETTIVTGAMVQDVISELDFENHFWGMPATVTAAPSTVGPAASESHQFLAQVTKRLDTMEKDFLQVPSALNGVCDSVASLKGELSAQVSMHETQVTDLRHKVEMLSLALDRLFVLNLPQGPAVSPGFVRRLLNGISGIGGKK